MTEDFKRILIQAAQTSAKHHGGKVSWTAVARAFANKGFNLTAEQLRSKYRVCIGISNKARYEKSKAVYKAESVDLAALLPSEIPGVPDKIAVVQNFEPQTLDANWEGNQKVRFALLGDTHINSKYAQVTYLHQFYDECRRQRIKHVYHTGDIDDGEQMRPGHQYECYTQGADDHVSEICRVYPKIDGMTTHFITGNHDASTVKKCGYNIGQTIADKRPDMEYLGADCAVIKLTPNCTLEIRHPWDGTAYAISYKIQKQVEAMSGGEKPNVFAVGHYHKEEYLLYRNVHCFQTACFCAQTPWMKGRGISCQIGGWIIEMDVDEQGYIQRINPQFIPYYVAIPDDWKNWRA